MKTFVAIKSALFAALVCLGPAPLLAGDKVAAVPRYQLKPGQQLDYFSTSDFRYGKGDYAGAITTKTHYRVWVVSKNEDGSWRLVIQSTTTQTIGKDQTLGQPAVGPLGCFELHADGRLVRNESLGNQLQPDMLFPLLPKDAPSATKGWQDRNERDDVLARHTMVNDGKAGAGLCTFDTVYTGPLDEIYRSSNRSKFFFDWKRGLIQRVESESTQGYGLGGKGTGTIELKEVEEKDPAWLKQFAEETARYFAANKAYADLNTRAEKVKDPKALLDEAEAVLKKIEGKLTLPLLRDQVGHQLKNHVETVRWVSE
jgi:hypothetical protein